MAMFSTSSLSAQLHASQVRTLHIMRLYMHREPCFCYFPSIYRRSNADRAVGLDIRAKLDDSFATFKIADELSNADVP